MLYRIVGERYHTYPNAQVETRESVIVAATPAFRWAIGEHIVDFQEQIAAAFMRVDYILDRERNPLLSENPQTRVYVEDAIYTPKPKL